VAEAEITPGRFVELGVHPWLVEAVQREMNDLQTLNLSCIADDARERGWKSFGTLKLAMSCSTKMVGGVLASAFQTGPRCWLPTFAP